jgi:tRNA (guanine-N7-)-methyltransferase
MNDRFVQLIQQKLVLNGSLHYWTDVEERYQETLKLLAAHTQLVGPFEVAERLAEHDLDYRTHFERRMRLNALPVYRAEFHKR